jgi:hypothetical protein
MQAKGIEMSYQKLGQQPQGKAFGADLWSLQFFFYYIHFQGYSPLMHVHIAAHPCTLTPDNKK